jgi:hypothetical protein
MVSRVSSRRWLLRDFGQASILLVWTAFAVGILIYFTDWSFIQRVTAARPQWNNGKQSGDGQDSNRDKVYNGAIILPERGPLCWEAVFDNRTGRMTEKGLVDCSQTADQSAAKNPSQGFEFKRLRAIGKAFNHEAD